MDPNANLKEQRQIIARMQKRDNAYPDHANEIEINNHNLKQAEDGERLAHLARALDEWIQKGGFLPIDWNRSKP